MSNKSISLVLGSGGARGLAHVGVIRWLEEHGHEINRYRVVPLGRSLAAPMPPGNWTPSWIGWKASRKKRSIPCSTFPSTWNSLVKGDKMMARHPKQDWDGSDRRPTCKVHGCRRRYRGGKRALVSKWPDRPSDQSIRFTAAVLHATYR